MPYMIQKNGDQFCVHKQMMDKTAGEKVPGGCHPTMEEAKKHMAALYANVPDSRKSIGEAIAYEGGAVKALGNGRIAGYGILFTTPADPDVQGEFFTKGTDLDLEIGDRRPIYYRHAAHPKIQNRKLGRAILKEVDEAGAFFEGELDLRDDYERYIYKLAELGKLGWSTGSAPHLVRKELAISGEAKAAEIKSWPVIEISLTPCPVEARTSAFTVKSLGEGEDELDLFIKSEEELQKAEIKEPYDIEGIPSIKGFCEDVSPSSLKDGSQRSQSAANAVADYIRITNVLGEAFHSYASRLVRRTENRFIKGNDSLDSGTVLQTTALLSEMERVLPAFESIREALQGIQKIAELSKAEQKALDERARLALMSYCQLSGTPLEEMENARASTN